MKSKLLVLVSLLVVSVGIAGLALNWPWMGRVVKAQEHHTYYETVEKPQDFSTSLNTDFMLKLG